jgi:hypothetical protein
MSFWALAIPDPSLNSLYINFFIQIYMHSLDTVPYLSARHLVYFRVAYVLTPFLSFKFENAGWYTYRGLWRFVFEAVDFALATHIFQSLLGNYICEYCPYLLSFYLASYISCTFVQYSRVLSCTVSKTFLCQ